jgi:hypothetical protein
MRVFAIVAILMILPGWAQQPAQPPELLAPGVPPLAEMEQLADDTQLTETPQAPEAKPASSLPPVYASQDAGSPMPANQTVTVPAGTKIPIMLTTPINTATSHAGDPVRAQIAFPVSVANTMAIPLGTYVEGKLVSVKRPKSGNRFAFQVQFTSMVFSNGYSIVLSGANSSAQLTNVSKSFSVASSPENQGGRPDERNVENLEVNYLDDLNNPDEVRTFDASPVALAFFAEPQQFPQPPPLPPLPKIGPSRGAIIGIAVGAIAAVVITAIAIAHHGGNNDVYLEAGAKIDLILQLPLSLDANSVAAATPVTPNN